MWALSTFYSKAQWHERQKKVTSTYSYVHLFSCFFSMTGLFFCFLWLLCLHSGFTWQSRAKNIRWPMYSRKESWVIFLFTNMLDPIMQYLQNARVVYDALKINPTLMRKICSGNSSSNTFVRNKLQYKKRKWKKGMTKRMFAKSLGFLFWKVIQQCAVDSSCWPSSCQNLFEKLQRIGSRLPFWLLVGNHFLKPFFAQVCKMLSG